MKAAILCGLIGTVSGESTRELFELRTRTAQVHSSPVSHGVVGSVLNKLFADQDQKIQTKIASISLTKKPTPSLLEMHATDTNECEGGIGVMIQSASKLPDKDWFFWGTLFMFDCERHLLNINQFILIYDFYFSILFFCFFFHSQVNPIQW